MSSIAFTNTGDTVLGAVTVAQSPDFTASLDINVIDPMNASAHSKLYLTGNLNAGDLNANAPADSGTGITNIHSTGDIVNLRGVSQIQGDELNITSDFGDIGGQEPDGTGSATIWAVKSTHCTW